MAPSLTILYVELGTEGTLGPIHQIHGPSNPILHTTHQACWGHMSRPYQFGMKCKSLLAIIFMHYIETTCTILATAPVALLQNIDDVLGVWHGDLQSLLYFKKLASAVHPNIKLTIDHTSNFFLSSNQDGKVYTEIYIKPTHSKIFLHYNSAHPTHIKLEVAVDK